MRSRHTDLAEEHYPRRRVGSAEYHTSRHGYGDASVVSYRFPGPTQREGPDFVLVHGIGVSARSYGPTAAALAVRGEMHLIDLPGYGRSPRPDRNFGIADHAEVVSRYLGEVGLDHPVLVGHSMGAQVVAEVAARHPEQVDHLVLIGPVLPPEARTLAGAAARMARDGLREPLGVTGLAVNDYLFRAGMGYLVEQIPHLLRYRLEEVADRVAASTLVLCGDADPVAPPEWGRRLAARFPRGRFATVPGPHGSMFAAPLLIAGQVDEHART
ncbi:MAG TPA: alpha/beta fold hydrolase [Propionicimonas sp.]|jgi:pimeloyl-ACP methyl ester carboxylesterase|nr:alpha/beta fold hydrolase [Propionicimonas sp.]